MSELIDDKIKARLEKALNSNDGEAQLTNLVEELKAEGWNQLQVYDVFETYMFWLENAGQQAESDVVMEVVACIYYGRCGHSRQLFGRSLSNEEIKKYRESKNQ